MKYHPKIQTKKKHCQSKKAIWTKGVIVGLLVFAAVLDFFSFAIHPEYWSFDMSPLVLFTNNIFIIALVKFGVVAGLIYMLIKVKGNDYFKFLWIMCALYLIIFQVLGAISNKQVADQAPPPEDAPSKEVRMQTAYTISMLYAYYPMMFSMISFWLFRWGWRDRNERA